MKVAIGLVSSLCVMVALAGAQPCHAESTGCDGTKWLWMELIGFDNEQEGFGVRELLSRMTIRPSVVSILFAEPEIVNGYENLERDYPIGDAHCSYCARPRNEERARQRWTAFQLKGLVDELHRQGVRAYPSFFERSVGPRSSYWRNFGAARLPSVLIDRHPELGYSLRTGDDPESICVIKRFSDGTYYEDFFAERLSRFCRDFGFDGFHASDGYGHPRYSLDVADFSKDVLDQFSSRNPGIRIPSGTREAQAEWILSNAYAEWCRFYAVRHSEFLAKAAAALRSQGKDVFVNTSWTRDPHEALFRFGVDYRLVERAGVNGFVCESSASVLEVEGWNTDAVSMLDRIRATYLRVAPSVRSPIAHLACIKDGMEQYNALRHAPMRMEAEVLGLGALCSGEKKAATRVLWCLSDGIAADEWRRLDRLRSLFPTVGKPEGVRVVWDDRAADREFDACCRSRAPSSCRLLEQLLHRGAVVSAALRTEEALADATLPLLILNPSCFDPDVLARLRRRSAQVVEFGQGKPDCPMGASPAKTFPKTWSQPLSVCAFPEAAYEACVTAVNAVAPVRPDANMRDLRLSCYRAVDGSLVVVATNERSTYLNARLLVSGPVLSVEALTESPSLPVEVERPESGDSRLRAKIPPAGAVVLKLKQ